MASRSLHASGRMSPSPTSSPHTASGPSSPLISGGCDGAIPFHQAKQPIFSYEGVGMIQKSQIGFQSNGTTAHHGSKHDKLWRNTQTRHYRDIIPSDNDVLAIHNRRAVEGDPNEFRDRKSYLADRDPRDYRDRKSYLADRVPQQQLVRDYARPNAYLDHKPSSPMHGGRMNGRCEFP